MKWCRAMQRTRAAVPDGECPLSYRSPYVAYVDDCTASSSMDYAQFSLELMDVCRTFLRRLVFGAVGGIIESAGCELSAASRARRQLRRTAYNG